MIVVVRDSSTIIAQQVSYVKIPKCMYHAVFDAYGWPQLTAG